MSPSYIFLCSGSRSQIGVCSNFSGSQIVDAQWAAHRTGGTPLVSLQPPYSLLARGIESDVLPACGRHGLGTLVYSPLGGGVLTGKYRRGSAPAADTRFARASLLTVQGIPSWHLDIAEKVSEIAGDLETTPTAVALAWVLGRRHVTSVIIGPRTFEQYEQNMIGFELQLPDEAVGALNAVSKVPN